MKSYYGGLIGTHQCSFERYQQRPRTASPSPRLGVGNPNLKLQLLLSQEWVKLRTANLADTFTGPSEQKPMKNIAEKGAWAYPGTAQIVEYPLF